MKDTDKLIEEIVSELFPVQDTRARSASKYAMTTLIERLNQQQEPKETCKADKCEAPNCYESHWPKGCLMEGAHNDFQWAPEPENWKPISIESVRGKRVAIHCETDEEYMRIWNALGYTDFYPSFDLQYRYIACDDIFKQGLAFRTARSAESCRYQIISSLRIAK